jgi:hypothetical protein
MAYALNYQAPYGNFHFQDGLMTVNLAEELIIDLALAQRVAAQRQELLADRTVAELIVVPAGHLLLEPTALAWWTDAASMAGVHHRALVIPARTKLWREFQNASASTVVSTAKAPTGFQSKLRVFSSVRKATDWIASFDETITPELASEMAVGVDVTRLVVSKARASESASDAPTENSTHPSVNQDTDTRTLA